MANTRQRRTDRHNHQNENGGGWSTPKKVIVGLLALGLAGYAGSKIFGDRRTEDEEYDEDVVLDYNDNNWANLDD